MDHLAALEVEVSLMAAALRSTDLAADVSGCPGWTVRELAGHVTGVHRWATAALAGTTAPAPYDESPGPGDVVQDYATAATEMLTRLTALPDDRPCWTFDRDNRTAGFWRRRQLHELAVHRWDVEPYDLSNEIATDGIDEVVDFFLPRQLHLGRTTLPTGTLVLVAPTRTWTVGSGEEETVVIGEPRELLLALYGRGSTLPGSWGQTQLTP